MLAQAKRDGKSFEGANFEVTDEDDDDRLFIVEQERVEEGKIEWKTNSSIRMLFHVASSYFICC